MSSFQDRLLVDLTDRISRDSNRPITGGAFGDVYKCRCRGDAGSSFLVAVKTLRYYEPEDPEENRRDLERNNKIFRRELGLLKRLEHPNIVPLLGVTLGFGPALGAVSPWMLHGTLRAYLNNTGQTLTMSERLQLAYGIGNGLEYLHSIPVFHGDLHSGNVLIDEDHNPRISDFGLASTIGKLQPGLSYLEQLSSRRHQYGAVRWAAPERLEGSEPDPSADIYSFGCMLFELLYGEIPWRGKTDCQVIALKLTAHEPPFRPDHGEVKDGHWALMVRCWSESPRRRPTACQVVLAVQTFLPVAQHPFEAGHRDRTFKLYFFFFFSQHHPIEYKTPLPIA